MITPLPSRSQEFGPPLESLLGHVIHAFVSPGEAITGDHQPGAGQLAVGFPIRVHIDGPALLQVLAEQGQGLLREHDGFLLSSILPDGQGERNANRAAPSCWVGACGGGRILAGGGWLVESRVPRTIPGLAALREAAEASRPPGAALSPLCKMTKHKFWSSDVVAGARCTGGLGVGYVGSGLDDQLLPGRPSRKLPERSKSNINSHWS